MKCALPPGLYGITDASLGDPVAWGAALVAAGCPIIQLRAKAWEHTRILDAGHALREVTDRAGALLIINDHPKIALAVNADGVHLGQQDVPSSDVRAMLPDKLIGLSTHSLAQVTDDLVDVADYIGFGPVFSTQTKAQAGAARGLYALRQAISLSPVPVVAIGGIGPSNIAQVRATMAHSWAVASALVAFPSAADAIAGMHTSP